MKVSVCITVYNEETTIGDLLASIIDGSKKPDEIVIVDAQSKDQTVDVIKHYQKKFKAIKLHIEKHATRSIGRNLSIKYAVNEIVALTDAGCVVKKNWLEKLTEPFTSKDVSMVAGFYEMTGKKSIQKAFSVFLGTLPSKFNSGFLPSTRSVAFRKNVWEKIGGFNEKLEDTAEDTMFNINALSQGIKVVRIKDAIVEWRMPESYRLGITKMYQYAKGDAKTRIIYHPAKGWNSHNIKSLTKFIRYMLFFTFLLAFYDFRIIRALIIMLLLVYAAWAYWKVYKEYEDFKAGFWGVAIQFGSDFAIMGGFIEGMIT